MRISTSFRAAFQVCADKVCADLTVALKAVPKVSKVSVENLTQGTGTLKAKVTFYYAEALVAAWLDNIFLRNDNGWPVPDIALTRSHETVDSMIAEVQVKYTDFVSVLMRRVLEQPLNPTLNRKQVLLMRQTALIDAGFDATAKLMPNGDFRLVITHECVKMPLAEVKVA